MTVTATYRNGTFVPDSEVSLPEGARVEIQLPGVRTERDKAVRAALMARFPNSIGTFTHEEAEQLRSAVAELRAVVDDERDC